MPTTNQLFFQLIALKSFLDKSVVLKNKLLEELIANATNPTIKMRRFRMLKQLCAYEQQIIEKIELLETDDPFDFLDSLIASELKKVGSRNA
jgi:hypothetical protein